MRALWLFGINCLHRFIADYKNCNISVGISCKTQSLHHTRLHQGKLNDKISSKYMNYLKNYAIFLHFQLIFTVNRFIAGILNIQ